MQVHNDSLNLTFYADPGHAWVKVPHHMIRDLGIGSKISRFSYMDRDHAYLEEDCDAALLIEKLRDQGVEVTFSEVYQEVSTIRDRLPRYVYL